MSPAASALFTLTCCAFATVVDSNALDTLVFADFAIRIYNLVVDNKAVPRSAPAAAFDTNYFSGVPADVDHSMLAGWKEADYEYERRWADDNKGFDLGDCLLEIFSLTLADTDKGCNEKEEGFGAVLKARIVARWGGRLTDSANSSMPESVRKGTYLTSVGVVPMYVHVKSGAALGCNVKASKPINMATKGKPVITMIALHVACKFTGSEGTTTGMARLIDVFSNGTVLLKDEVDGDETVSYGSYSCNLGMLSVIMAFLCAFL